MPTQPNQVHDEADNESISDLLSPSDGYFAEGHPHPGDVLVPDPSQRPTSLDKEREAREELQAGQSTSAQRRPQVDTSSAAGAYSNRSEVQTHPQRATSRTSPRRQSPATNPATINEATPLISSAPPAYSPPEPGSPYHQHMRNGSLPGIHETTGRTNALFPDSRQDMGGDTEALLGPDKNQKRWPSRLHDWWEDNSYTVVKYIVLTLAIIAAIGFLTDLIMELSHENKERHGEDKFPDGYGIPSSCRIAGRGDVDFAWQDSSSWKLLHVTRTPSSGANDYHVQTYGRIELRSAPEDTTDDIKVDLQFHFSTSTVGSEIEFSKEENLLKIVTPGSVQNYNNPSHWSPCLYLNVTVWVKPGLQQDVFGIATTTLGVDIHSNYSAFARSWNIGSAVGSVRSYADGNGEAHWGGRDIKIVTDSSSIHGAFPLYDSLWLETSAGSIDTDLTLHPGRDGAENEALLTLKTSAGSISANTPALNALHSGQSNKTIDSIPKRRYTSNIIARAGSIKLDLVHGVSTYIKSNAGSVIAALTPWSEPWRESSIVVESNTGGVDMTVKDSLPYKGEALRKLSGSYRYDSGHLTLRYPAEWEGNVKGDLLTGNLNIDWPGLQIIKRVRQGPFSHLEARKGTGDAMIKFTGATGSTALLGKGGSKYPNSEDGSSGHDKKVNDGDEGSWPIFIPPLSAELGE